jgi:hypothetical protein
LYGRDSNNIKRSNILLAPQQDKIATILEIISWAAIVWIITKKKHYSVGIGGCHGIGLLYTITCMNICQRLWILTLDFPHLISETITRTDDFPYLIHHSKKIMIMKLAKLKQLKAKRLQLNLVAQISRSVR